MKRILRILATAAIIQGLTGCGSDGGIPAPAPIQSTPDRTLTVNMVQNTGAEFCF